MIRNLPRPINTFSADRRIHARDGKEHSGEPFFYLIEIMIKII